MNRSSDITNQFEQLVDRFLEGLFHFSPTLATSLGFHEYDALLEERTADAVQGEIERLRDFQHQLQRTIDPSALSYPQRIDLEVLQSAIESELLELQEIRDWQRNPAYYAWLASDSIYSLLIRDYAPLPDRLRAVAERQRRIPALLEAGRENLRAALSAPGGVPKIWVEIALEDLEGAKNFFQTVVPEAAQRSNDASLTGKVIQQNQRILAALEEMVMFLRNELLEAARGDFALGADVFRRKLRFDEAVATPIADILARGEKELRRTQQQMHAVAQQIDPDLSLDEVIEQLAGDHAGPNELVPSYQRRIDMTRQFVIDHDLVTVPEGELRLVETPAFLRSLIFAALDPPGSFERAKLPTYFYVTPTKPNWSATEQDEYLRQHNDYSQIITIVHEAFPGHYVQCAHLRRTPSRVRRIFASGTFVEGWAHYGEQLVMEHGFGQDDPKIQLFQLHEALWRIGRLVVATRMHTEGLSFDDAVELFMRECYQERANAIREVKRFTTDPLVLIYSWGKWQIQDLREAYRERRGPEFSLKEFHDRLLGEGEPPIAIVRRLLLDHEDRGS
jgi:uncharacterized protein (DUF885 family)